MLKHSVIPCVFAVVAACGGGGGGSISPEDLADEFEGAQCDYLVRCEGIENRQVCDQSIIFNDTEYQTILAAIEDGTIKYDSGAAGECADAYADRPCAFEGFYNDA